MREILFRGKRKDNGEWVYGFYIENELFDGRLEPSIIPVDEKGAALFDDDGYDIEIKVNPETVGQDTGVTDGKETGIFEGDIVKIHLSGKPAIGVVEFGITGIAAYIVKNIDKVSSNYVLEFDKPNLYEVIGNVFDNPELMEGKKWITIQSAGRRQLIS
ncbi:MAG: hypothetical protein IIW48_08170 [Clostridia bacterium]|nr:hypothetical protein [Clostridia bacterium]